jgi:hypothetical protein
MIFQARKLPYRQQQHLQTPQKIFLVAGQRDFMQHSSSALKRLAMLPQYSLQPPEY